MPSSFPLNRPWWLGGNVIGHPVDALHFVDDARGCFAEEFMGKRVVVRGHAVDRCHGPQGAGEIVGSAVAHNAHGAHR